jgi:hypothetical protein
MSRRDFVDCVFLRVCFACFTVVMVTDVTLEYFRASADEGMP